MKLKPHRLYESLPLLHSLPSSMRAVCWLDFLVPGARTAKARAGRGRTSKVKCRSRYQRWAISQQLKAQEILRRYAAKFGESRDGEAQGFLLLKRQKMANKIKANRGKRAQDKDSAGRKTLCAPRLQPPGLPVVLWRVLQREGRGGHGGA